MAFAPSWGDVRDTLHAHPELLSDAGIELFEQLITRLQAVDDVDGVRQYERYRALLVLARRIGVDDAVAELIEDDLSPELRSVLAPLSEYSARGIVEPGQLSSLRRALGLTAPDRAPKMWASLHGMLGEALLDDSTGDHGQNVEEAIAAFRTALARQSTAVQPVLWAITQNNLARAFTERVQGDAEQNNAQAVAAFRQALEPFTDEAGPRIIAVDMERTLQLLAVGTAAELRHAIDILRQTLEVVHEMAASDIVADLPRVAALLGDQVRLSMDDQDAFTEAPDAPRSDGQAWEHALVGARLLNEYREAEDGDSLGRALTHLEEAARTIDVSSPRRGYVLDLLGEALWRYHERVQDPRAREQAISAHREASALLPHGSPAHLATLANLAEGLNRRYKETGERQDLDEAVELAGEILSLLPPDSPERAPLLQRLGAYRLLRYYDTNDLADLDAALEALVVAEELGRSDGADRLATLTNLSSALCARFEHAGDIVDLDRAIALDREALDHADRYPTRSVLLNRLGGSLQDRFRGTARSTDLDQAIESLRQALELTPETAPDRADLLVGLGMALSTRYDLAQDVADLGESIALVEQAVERCPPGTPYRDVALNALSFVLRDRYFRTGDLADLAQSIELARAALELTPAGSPSRWAHLMGLGIAVRHRYERSGDPSDLDEAITLWQEALDGALDTPSVQASILTGLALAYYGKHRHTRDARDLQEGIDRARKVVELTAPSAALSGSAVNSLATGLLERFWRDRDPSDLDEAEAMLRQAAAAHQGGVHGLLYLHGTLARVLSNRYQHAVVGDPAELEEARSLFRQAVTAGLVLSPEDARADSMAWGSWAAGRNSWDEAAEAYGYGLQAMEQLFRVQLTRAAKEQELHDAQGLAAAAAYALARSGAPADAAVALERGRALILSETLERTRAGLEELTARGREDLVEHYRQSSGVLAKLEYRALVGVDGPAAAIRAPGSGHGGDLTSELRTARAALDAAITAIRRVEGYERFLDPPRFDDLRAAATTPLVYLASVEQGGIALVVSGDEVEVCWLPALTDAIVRTLVETYLQAYRARRTEAAAWERELDDTTARLWDMVMEPVVAALAPAPRAALVPAGLLGLLPLHAAWRPDATAPSGRRYALDDLLLTYSPNARTRVAAAEQARVAACDGVLAVEDPRPVSAGPLPAAGYEVRAALGHFARARRLDGARAALPAVKAALGEHPVLHFACHGFADVAEPLASGLLLADDESLTLRDILGHGSLGARLVVLSACETAVPGANLPDEVVSLPAGLLQAGVAGVVGSLWSVSDASTMALMARFYKLWRADGLDPPEALRRAQQWVRDTPNGAKRVTFADIGELSGSRVPAKAQELWERARAHRSPYYWAAFVYVGE
ncbi:CHAT domain-containing tetratricopeptide repeat protein [Streptomyces xylophagus]|uniref:CHAT domain-containing tetratricopeptide repeat protein n=1 Tax=Streptomyces xylophagus TaxID=285514 RepID=UPI0005BA5C35|nr:CHAT domain-containing protein [Streptomyces xylophagus]